MPLAQLKDLRLNALQQGPTSAPALMFLDPPGTDLSIRDDLLPSGLRILRYDHRGQGTSEVPEPPCAMGALRHC